MSLISVCSPINGNDTYLMELLGALNESRGKSGRTVVPYQVLFAPLVTFSPIQIFPFGLSCFPDGGPHTIERNSYDFPLLARC